MLLLAGLHLELGLTGDTVLPVLPVTQPPPRCSRSVQPSLLIAWADPDPDNLRGACWLQSWVETAARTCLWAAWWSTAHGRGSSFKIEEAGARQGQMMLY